MVDSDINWSACNVGCAVRGGGNVIRKTGGIIWIVAPSTAQVSSSWPMGYCNGDSGAAPNQAQRITGRSGWFIPDVTMLVCANACRSYWDTYTCCLYHSSTEGPAGTCAGIVIIPSGYVSCTFGKSTLGCVRPFRVVCY